MAFADLGERCGEGILEPGISLLQFLHDIACQSTLPFFRLIPGKLGVDESVALHEDADKRPSTAPSVRSNGTVIFVQPFPNRSEAPYGCREEEGITAFLFQETPSHRSFHRFP